MVFTHKTNALHCVVTTKHICVTSPRFRIEPTGWLEVWSPCLLQKTDEYRRPTAICGWRAYRLSPPQSHTSILYGSTRVYWANVLDTTGSSRLVASDGFEDVSEACMRRQISETTHCGGGLLCGGRRERLKLVVSGISHVRTQRMLRR